MLNGKVIYWELGPFKPRFRNSESSLSSSIIGAGVILVKLEHYLISKATAIASELLGDVDEDESFNFGF